MYFRQSLPDGIERSGIRRRRRADGPDHEGLSSTGSSPATTRSCASSGRRRSAPSNSPGRPAAGTPIATASWKACSTTPTTSSSTGRIRCAASTTSARCGRARRWRAPSATPPPRRSTGACSTAAASGSTPICSPASITSRRSRAFAADKIAKGLRSGMGADDPEHPQYQVGDGCLVDQLLGQYLADVAGLGPLLVAGEHPQDARIHLSLQPQAAASSSTIRCSAPTSLNDEAALLVCDYGKGKRPEIPFPYYAEAWTGLEYSTAALMLYQGMTERGIQCIAEVAQALRRRAPQSVGRAGMRPSLRARHGVVVRSAGAQRLPLRRAGAPRDRGATRTRAVPLVLVGGTGLGHVHARRRGDSRWRSRRGRCRCGASSSPAASPRESPLAARPRRTTFRGKGDRVDRDIPR